MATIPALPRTRFSTDRLLGWAALAMLAILVAALVRGRAHWPEIPPLVWAHLATIAVALTLTPVMLGRAKGDRWHRRLGYVWVAALMGTAALTFGMRYVNPGHLSFIHLFSVFVLVNVPLGIMKARRHDIRGHRRGMRGTVIGALIVAGLFTLPFGRLLGQMLFG